MNKKEIAEIKKQFTPDRCTITRICGCCVDGEKQRKGEMKEAFLSLSEEEMFKYFDIFKKTLSGTPGRNLLNMDFPLAQEEEGGTQDFLMRLKKSRLEDDELLEQFYERIIETYDYAETYYIILIHCVYDIPGKASDGLEMFDASDEVYEYLLMSICPVNLSKAGLCYNAEADCIEDRIRDWIVEMPEVGFLFPVFNDRSTDIHSLLYYAKKPEHAHAGFAAELLGCEPPLSPDVQKDSFNTLLADTLGDDCEFETVVHIHEKLSELVEERKEDPDPVMLSKPELKNLLLDSGVSEEQLENYDEQYDLNAGENTSLMAANITNVRKIEVNIPEIRITVSPEKAALIETQVLDGRKCLVIPLEGDVEVNGVQVR